MKKLILLTVFGLFLSVSAQAQVGQPDCIVTNTFTTTGRAVFDNRGIAQPVCTTWHLVYFNEGFSALSIELDEAPSAGGAPGAWVTWPNLASGTQPLTATTQAQITGFKYFPWVSINLTSVTGTGTLRAEAYGYRPNLSNDANLASNAVAGGTASGVPPTSTNPTLIAGITLAGNVQVPLASATPDFGISVAASNGTSPAVMQTRVPTTVQTFLDPATGNGGPIAVETFGVDPCQASGVAKLHAFNNITTATTTTVVPLSASTVIYVCQVTFNIASTTTASTVFLEQGTGAACATGPTALTATYTNAGGTILATAVNIGGGAATTFKTTAANGLCAVSTVGSTPTTAVDITYVQL